jgi:hypothetical protein
MKINTLKILRSTLAAALLLGASALSQASVVYAFTSTDVGGFGVGPYGTVTLVESGTSVLFTVALRADMNFVNTGNHSIFSFNSTGVAIGDVSNILFNGVADPGVTVVTPGTNPPFGNGTFTMMLDCTVKAGCSNGAPGAHFDPLTFSIANATYADFGILAPGTTAFFASDVICMTGGCNGATGAIGVVTGGGDGDGQVPEPVSVSLFALGLLGLGVARRRRS